MVDKPERRKSMRLQFIAGVSLVTQLKQAFTKSAEETVLDLTNNQLGVVNQQELVSMFCLLRSTKISELILSGTGLYYKTGKELSELIACFAGSKINKLNLNNNFLASTKNQQELVECLSGLENTEIYLVDLRDNGFERLNGNERRAVLGKLEKLAIQYNLDVEKKSFIFFQTDNLSDKKDTCEIRPH